MKIIQNPDKNRVEIVLKAIKDNDGYCPCSLIKNEDTICMCKEFREQKSGKCRCGLYIKEEDTNEN